ncbi:MAG: hypothetical protein IJZ89_08185, partial [Clostridia bacterium]|nr:hypothetical protein [Clostridia bacterium]
VSLGELLGAFWYLWGGPKVLPRGMSAYAVSYFCEDKKLVLKNIKNDNMRYLSILKILIIQN